ncbi:MAG TPA: S-layer homology domain-containing protein [Clostridia bacterium]|nr:S-layer homology domain-containing protein [Clostridia bacterium]
MRNLKKLLSFIVTFTLLAAVTVPAFSAEGTYNYEKEANILNNLGLYEGNSTTTFDPDLGSRLDRQTGVVMLLKLFGLEEAAAELTDEEADAALAKFEDTASIADWAKRSVACAVKNGLVEGMSDGTFAPTAKLVGKAYCTLILRQLGFTPDYQKAAVELADVGGLTKAQAIKFSDKALIKDDLVGISFGALSARDKDSVAVITSLVEKGIIDPSAAAGAVDAITNADVKASLEDAIAEKKAEADAALKKGDTTSVNDNDNDDDDIVMSELEVNVAATGVKKLTVTFNKAVDSSKAVFTVMKGSTIVTQSGIAFADDKKSAVITLDSKLSLGDYTISVAGLSDTAKTKSISVADEKVDRIEFPSTTLVIDRANGHKATTRYKVSNQYGEDITSNNLEIDFSFEPFEGETTYGNGILTLELPYYDDDEFEVGRTISVFAYEPEANVSAHAILTVVAASQVAEVTIENLINTKNKDKVLCVGGTAEDFKLVMSFKDQYGNSMNSERFLAAMRGDTVFTLSSDSVVTIDTTYPNLQIEKIDGVDKVVLPLASIEGEGTVKFSAISEKTGVALDQFDIVVKEKARVDVLTLSAPALAVAGESFNIPFGAVDQYGFAVTTASGAVFVEDVTSMSVKGEEIDHTVSIEFKQDDVNGTVYLEVNAKNLTTTQTLTINAITCTGKPAQLSFTLNAPAVPSVISGIRNFAATLAIDQTSSLNEDDVIVQDQYGREDDVFGTAGYSIVVKASGNGCVTLGEVTGFTAEDGPAVTFTGAKKGTDEITIMLQKDGIDVEGSKYTFNINIP